MFYEFGEGIHSAFLLVTCMQSAHVDSTCTVTDCLLEVHKSLQATTCLVRDACDSIKHADGFTDFLLEVQPFVCAIACALGRQILVANILLSPFSTWCAACSACLQVSVVHARQSAD